MVYLFLAILSSAMIAIVMRLSTGRIRAEKSMLATNYLVCSLLSAGFAGFRVVQSQAPGFGITLGLGLVSGVLYLAGLISMQNNTGRYGVVLSSVFMKLGLLVPMVLSVALFREVPTMPQIAGFAIAVCAIVLINRKQEPGGKGFGMGLIWMLLLCGGSEAMSKIFEVCGPAALSSQFLFYTFATAFALCLVLVVRQGQRPSWREVLYGTLIGVPNFFSAKFLLGALQSLPAVVVYPTFSVATMLIVTLTGVIAFRERLSRLQWVALAAIVVALVLLNL